jgi:hypothetical protein
MFILIWRGFMKRQVAVLGCGIVFLAVAVLFAGCLSLDRERQNSGTRQMNLLDPAEVVGKKLAGSDEDGMYSFLLKEDGTLEYTVDGNRYTGSWSFDKSAPMYRYTFDWTENGEEQGYIMDLARDGAKISVFGHWYLTDAYITFRKDVEADD